MKLVWIWEPQDMVKRLEFISWIHTLNLGMEGRTAANELIYKLERQRTGRMAIWANLYPYPYCCGITILAQPGWDFEYLGSEHRWPNAIRGASITNAGAISSEHIIDTVRFGGFSDLQSLKNSITSHLSEQIGSQGCYMISDYASGRGQLFPFVDELMDRSKFSMESVAHFQNGNTGAMLGTWIARNLQKTAYRLQKNSPFLDVNLNKSFNPLSVSEAILSGKGYV